MTGAKRFNCTTVLMICTVLVLVGAAGVSVSETRQHGSHVHGVGKLNIALDGNDLIFELSSPAANIVGFEHAPENDQQTHEVHEAIELLKEGEKMFALTAKAQCRIHEAHVESEMLEEHTGEHEAHSQEHEKHDAHHEEHEDVHSEEKHAEGSVHSDFEATYHFECSNPSKLKAIDVLLFSNFPNFEELEVQLLTPKGQTAVELTPKKFKISL